jgi:hypothetical protein
MEKKIPKIGIDMLEHFAPSPMCETMMKIKGPANIMVTDMIGMMEPLLKVTAEAHIKDKETALLWKETLQTHLFRSVDLSSLALMIWFHHREKGGCATAQQAAPQVLHDLGTWIRDLELKYSYFQAYGRKMTAAERHDGTDVLSHLAVIIQAAAFAFRHTFLTALESWEQNHPEKKNDA